MSTEQERRQFVEGLRRMADFFEAHSGVPFPRSVELNVWIRGNEREVLARAARALGTAEKTTLDRWFILKKNFSENVTVDFNAERDKVRRKVITGRRLVEQQVITAKPEEIIPAHEVEEFEWRCDEALLDGGAE